VAGFVTVGSALFDVVDSVSVSAKSEGDSIANNKKEKVGFVST